LKVHDLNFILKLFFEVFIPTFVLLMSFVVSQFKIISQEKTISAFSFFRILF